MKYKIADYFAVHVKKTSLILTFAFIFLGMNFALAAAPTEGLVGYYTFDEGTGTSITDGSGSGNSATLRNSPSWTTGKIGGGLSFDGTDDFVEINNTSLGNFDGSDFTTSGWFKITSSGGGPILSKRSVCGPSSFWNVGVSDTNSVVVEFDHDTTGVNYLNYFGGPNVRDGSWHHFAIIRTGNTSTMYVDGVQASSGSAPAVSVLSNTVSLKIGASGGCPWYFNGVLDDIRIYSRALSGTEIRNIYDAVGSGTVVTPPVVTPAPVVVPPINPPSDPSSGSRIFYIDWSTGSDTNSGTSKATPWKRHPYMNGFGGSYSHQAGDSFIFKGGVTWPNAAFQMKIKASGESDSKRDYYGADNTWYAGSGWSRPVFDLESKSFAGSEQIAIDVSNVSNITIDNIEIKNQYIGNSYAWLHCAITSRYSTNVTVRNAYIHDWIMDRSTDENVGGFCGWGETNLVLEYSEIGPGGPTGIGGIGGLGKGGVAARNIDIIRYNKLHGAPNLVLGAALEVYGNEIYDLRDSFDPGSHENAIETFGQTSIHDNYIYDIAVGMTIGVGAGSPSQGGNFNIYNNVIYNVGPVPVQLDCREQATTRTGARIFNNTLEHASYDAIRSFGLYCDYMDIRNNVYITDATHRGPVCYKGVGDCQSPKTVTEENNILLSQAQATAAGYTKANRYAPTSANSPTVNKGSDLSSLVSANQYPMGLMHMIKDISGAIRPQSLLWDVGAYEYTGFVNTPPVQNPPSSSGGAVAGGGGTNNVGNTNISAGSGAGLTQNIPLTNIPILGSQVRTTSNLNMRMSPGLSGKVVTKAVQGTILSVTGSAVSSGGYNWIPVKASDGSTGWVVDTYVIPSVTSSVTSVSSSYRTSAKLNVRSTPSIKATILGQVQSYSSINVTGMSTKSAGYNWLSVKLPNGAIGWAVDTYITNTPSTSFQTNDRVNTTAKLNVRTLPNVSGKLLGVSLANDKGTIISGPISSGINVWYQIKLDSGKTGWVVGQYLSAVR